MLRSALLALVCLAYICMPAHADQRQQIDVPAGELIAALKALTQQTGADLVYRSEQLAGLHTQGASGAFSAQEAVTKLLEGTALTVRTDPSGAMLIALPRPAPRNESALSSAPKAPVQQSAAKRELPKRPLSPVVPEVKASASPADSLRTATDIEAALTAYNEELQSAERNGGLESERVLAPLLGLGKTLAASGRHAQAVPRLQRALAIQRSHYGLFDLRQQDTLKTLAASLTSLDRTAEAQDLMIYRVRAAEKNYGEGNLRVIPAVCDLGNWFAEVGMPAEARMTFQMALNIAGDREGLNAPILVEPLRGIARTYMRRMSYPRSWRPRPPRQHCHGQGPCWFPNTPRPYAELNGLNREGERALQRALRILEADPGASTQTLIETLIQMGDWRQIQKAPSEALPYYQRAWKLIHEASDLSSSAATALDVPVRVYYPTPDIVADVPKGRPEDAQAHHVQVEFTVAADGLVQDARIVDHDTREQDAQEIFDAVRAARFRPKFVDGQAVAATGITYREVFWTDKSGD